MFKMAKIKEKLPKLDYTAPDFHIPESMDSLFADFEDLLRSECLGLEDHQIELALEMFAYQLFNNYAVLYGPQNLHPTVQ